MQTVKGMDINIFVGFQKLFKSGFHLYFSGNSLFSSEIILKIVKLWHTFLLFYISVFLFLVVQVKKMVSSLMK